MSCSSEQSKEEVRKVFWNGQCRRVMQVLMGAWEEKDSQGRGSSTALWRVADCEDVLWLTAVWVQHDEHDVVIDVSDTHPSQVSKCSSEGPKQRALVTNLRNLSVIENEFLVSLTSLTAIDFAPSVRSITTIPSRFMARCKSLKSLDLSLFTNLSKVPDYFLSDCNSLGALQLMNLPAEECKVQFVGRNFLGGCESLVAVDLQCLHGVLGISEHFLSTCVSLREVDLRPLSLVERVGQCFMFRCSSLRSLDLSPLKNLRLISGFFLCGCSSLVEIDLGPLSAISVIPEAFLYGCSSLQKLDLGPLTNATKIESFFLWDCSSLTSLDFSALREVSELALGQHRSSRGDFLNGCVNVTSVVVKGLPKDSPLRRFERFEASELKARTVVQ